MTKTRVMCFRKCFFWGVISLYIFSFHAKSKFFELLQQEGSPCAEPKYVLITALKGNIVITRSESQVCKSV